MCGFIAGKYLRKDLDKLLDLMEHRGLKGFRGKKIIDNIYMGHVSLPFVNLDPKVAIQPYVDERNTPFMLVGEIFNHNILGTFQNDTECISELYKEYGHDVFHEFDGFWSFTTIVKDSLICYTDHLGIKPVYYRTDMEALASEITVLKELGKCSPNETYLSNVLKWGYNPGPETPWNEIKQIPPGHYYYEGRVYPYWDWKQVNYGNLKDDMIKSVRNRLKGQREVALLLSGGLDSTIIYSVLKSLKQSIKVIHVENEEAEFAEKVLSYFGNVDEVLKIGFNNVGKNAALLIHQTPVDLGSVKPQIAMAREIEKLGIHCVLSGDGADELFGGYRRSNDYDSQHSDVFMELPYYHLPRLDRTMMKSTIELRCPFLAPYIIRQALKVPYALRNGVKKALINAFGDDIPMEIIRRKKHALKTPEIRSEPLQQRISNITTWREIYD